MPDDPRVQQLLDELLESHVTPEEVCGSCVELLPVVRDRWRQMCRARAELDALFPPEAEPGDSVQEMVPGDTPLPVIPGYEVESVLGLGGMGVVFRARHLRLNRVVALKMALAGAYAGPHERERFQREAEAVASLTHPNVVQIHEVGDSGGRPYFTMEYVEGGSLAQKLAATPLPAREAATLLATLAGAVHSAHASGIVHRDLKPANVLLTSDGTPKISDFGLARRLSGGAGLTRTGTAMGTPSYMAPEQAFGSADAAGPTADVYALGAILYELLTGRPPFRAETGAETIQQVLAQDPVPPSRLNGKVPRDLETICLKCLHKDPRFRYATAAALADDVHCFLRGETIAARPEGRLRRLTRKVRRRPALSAAIAVSTLFALALIGGGLWFLSDRQAQAAATKAELAAVERAADEDLNEMTAALQRSAWVEARTAMERAKGRLGDRGSADLRRRLDRGTLDLRLAVRLDDIRLNRAIAGQPGLENYEKAFGEAGLGRFGDDPEAMAKRVRESDVRQALIDALDDWALCANPERHAACEAWLLDVTRRTDPDPWRDRMRDPKARKDKSALIALADTADVDRTPVKLLTALGDLLLSRECDVVPFLTKIQRRYPTDFWANLFLAHNSKNPADAIRYNQAALAIRPGTIYLYFNLGVATVWAGRYDEALYYFSEAVRLNPASATFRAGLSRCFLELGRDREAFVQMQQALALRPNAETFGKLQMQLRMYALRQRDWDGARAAWKKVLEADPAEHKDWYGYAELCLFLGREDEYRQARTALLAKFGTTADPQLAERTGRACLLLSASGDELRQAVALTDRAMSADQSKYKVLLPSFTFVKGLADFRQGRFEQAISAMRGEAFRLPGPTARLILAMSLFQTGKTAEARQVLGLAMLAHDWRPNRVRDQDGYICHVLRREAEKMILPNLTAFVEGKYQPRDVDERIALLGLCQFTDRSLIAAQCYAEIFVGAPSIADNFAAGHRYLAACAATRAGCGKCVDAAHLGETERAKWRAQARAWLRSDLAAWGKALGTNLAAARDSAKQRLAQWQTDPDLAGLRDPAELEKLPADERKDCLALWGEVDGLLKQTAEGR